MIGIIFTLIISVCLPILLFIYAILKRNYVAFIFGVIAFVGSQILIRLPILQYLQTSSTVFTMFQVKQPVLFAIIIGLSAGLVEELARFIMMRFFMKGRDWQSGFLFGAGHGGIEAILFVGVPVLFLLFTSPAQVFQNGLLIGGFERFFAMLLHIGLSIIVLRAVVEKKFIYLVVAIIIHGFIDALVGIFPLIMSPDTALIAIESLLALIALAVFMYSILIKRKEVL